MKNESTYQLVEVIRVILERPSIYKAYKKMPEGERKQLTKELTDVFRTDQSLHRMQTPKRLQHQEDGLR